MTLPTSRAVLPLLVLAVAVLVLSGSAWASPGPVNAAGPHGQGVMTDHAMPDLVAVSLSPATDEAGLPWSTLLAALMASVLAWCLPRRALVVALILLLAIFAFENGLHSVHHGFDPVPTETCAASAASTNVAAVAADAPPTTELLSPLRPGSLDGARPAPLARFICPDQGRAPPIPAA